MSRCVIRLAILAVGVWALGCDDGGGGSAEPDPGGGGTPLVDAGPGGGGAGACVAGTSRCGPSGVETCVAGAWSAGQPCEGGFRCEGGRCVEIPCQPQCEADQECGDDGCGGSCGECADGWICEEGFCTPPEAMCGDGTCDPGEDCTRCNDDCACGEGEACEAGECVCVPDCTDRLCGDDGCGGSCGDCDGDFVCEEGACVPPPPECGDMVCDERESCVECPIDCGFCCGNGACAPEQGENCATCPGDCECAEGDVCDFELRACAAPCRPMCDGLQCGPDGCGGSCGGCADGQACGAAGVCAPEPAMCGDNVCDADEDCATCAADCGDCCGDDVCGAGENCVTCEADCACGDGDLCDAASRQCRAEFCEPDCGARQCGPDGCGGTCGRCGGGRLCDPDTGMCAAQCVPRCQGRDCGGDGCGGSCGECDANSMCTPDGQCEVVCVPDCDGKVCGDDGCNGSCGACGDNEACNDDFQCECVPSCDGRECGSDGCEGSCGGCDGDFECNAQGQCAPPCEPQCDDRACGEDGCGGVCGVCEEGEICSVGGQCLGDRDCEACDPGEVCLHGGCRGPAELCGADNVGGLCPPLTLCDEGGECAPFVDADVCDDFNPCTEDRFDPALDTCVHTNDDMLECDDGDGCATYACVEGACIATPIDGCEAAPFVEAVDSPTNEPVLVLRGGKAPGTGISIDGEPAIPESPDVKWSVMINLAPGLNEYAVVQTNQGAESAPTVVRVYYDPDPPTMRVSPPGGVFLDAVTVTATANEAARVYWTADGSTPDETSLSFEGARTFRVFNDTTLTFLARDLSGNWQEMPEAYDFEITGAGNTWRDAGELPEALAYGASATVDGVVYFSGGTDGDNPQSGVFSYDPAAGAWMNLPALPVPRTRHAMVPVGSGLYVIGGETEGIPLNNTEAIIPGVDDAWLQLAPMPTTRFGLAAAEISGLIYTFGGQTNGDVVLNLVERLDTESGAWDAMVPPMPRARVGHTAHVHDGLIYLFGGIDGEGNPVAEVDVLDPAANEWLEATAMPAPRAWMTVATNRNAGAINGGYTGLVISGGIDAAGNPSDRVDEYVLDDDTWRLRTPMPASRAGASGAAIVRPVEMPMSGSLDDARYEVWVLGGEGPLRLIAAIHAWHQNQDYIERMPDLPESRFMHSAVPYRDRIYVFGGRSFQESTEGWVFDPETGVFGDMEPLPAVQNRAGAARRDDVFHLVGGMNRFGIAIPNHREFDPATAAWRDRAPMLVARADPAIVVHEGEVWAIGGENNGPLQSVNVYDPDADEWRAGPVLPEGRTGAVAVSWQGQLLVMGGFDGDGAPVNSTLRLAEGDWAVVGGDAIEVAHGAAVRQGDTQLNVFGGRLEGAPRAQVISYDLAENRIRRAPTIYQPAADYLAAATHNGDIYLFGGNDSAEIGPEGTASVLRLRGSCFNGVVDRREILGVGEPGVGLKGGCGLNSVTWPSLGQNIVLPAEPNGFQFRQDLNANGISDGGNDAFDGFGNLTISFNGNSTRPDMRAGDRAWAAGDYRGRMVADFPNRNIYRIRITPEVPNDPRRVTISLNGNLGADGSARGSINSLLPFGSGNLKYMWIDDSSDAGGDPKSVHLMVPILVADQGAVAYTRGGDDASVRANNVVLPATYYLYVGYLQPGVVAEAFATDIAPDVQ